jgi:hypothetical protein
MVVELVLMGMASHAERTRAGRNASIPVTLAVPEPTFEYHDRRFEILAGKIFL